MKTADELLPFQQADGSVVGDYANFPVANGRMQAIEVGNEIAENQAEQLMKLRQLMMADMQSKAAFQSAQIQKDLTTQADTDKFFGQATITSDGVTF